MVQRLFDATPVAIVNIHRSVRANRVDMLDYTHPAITEIIPTWKTKDGRYISVKTGEEVRPATNSQERNILLGTEFEFPDGEVIILIRNLTTRERYFSPIDGLKGTVRYGTRPFSPEKLDINSTLL